MRQGMLRCGGIANRSMDRSFASDICYPSLLLNVSRIVVVAANSSKTSSHTAFQSRTSRFVRPDYFQLESTIAAAIPSSRSPGPVVERRF
jgi:hypothetical protein